MEVKTNVFFLSHLCMDSENWIENLHLAGNTIVTSFFFFFFTAGWESLSLVVEMLNDLSKISR